VALLFITSTILLANHRLTTARGIAVYYINHCPSKPQLTTARGIAVYYLNHCPSKPQLTTARGIAVYYINHCPCKPQADHRSWHCCLLHKPLSLQTTG